MMTGPIRRLKIDRVERREDTRLPSVWIGNDKASPPVLVLSWLYQDKLQSALNVDRDTPILIMLASESGPAVAELLAHGEAGERVYVLVSSSWNADKADGRLLSCPKVLIRRVSEVPSSGVYRPNGSRIWFGGTSGGQNSWCLRLDSVQAEAFRQLFLRLFWHEANEEAWTNGKKLAFRVAGDRPFDVPDLSSSAAIRLLPSDAHLEAPVKDSLLHISTGSPPQSTLRRMWFPVSGEHHERLVRLDREGVPVVWEDRGLPDLIISSNSGAILLPGSRNRMRIELTIEQSADAERILEAKTAWTFRVDARLGDHAQDEVQFWLPNETGARSIETEERVSLSDVHAESLRAVATTQPSVWPAAQPLALSVRYSWTAVPPRLPAGTDEDALVGRWKKVDEDWSQRLAQLLWALEAAEGNRGRIGKSFSRLMGAMLGFELTQSRLLTAVKAMEKQRPTADGPAEAQQMLTRLAELEEKSRQLEGDLKEAESKARQDEAREKQEAAWRSRVETAQRSLAERRKDFTAAEEQQSGLKSELSAIEESLKSEETEGLKDIEVRKKKLADDLTKLNGKLTRLRDEIKALETGANEPFKFNPPVPTVTRPAQTNGRFVPQTSMARQNVVVPEETLPAVGKLRNHRGQRYLVIEKWEELNIGEQEAERLKAKLVAPENA